MTEEQGPFLAVGERLHAAGIYAHVGEVLLHIDSPSFTESHIVFVGSPLVRVALEDDPRVGDGLEVFGVPSNHWHHVGPNSRLIEIKVNGEEVLGASAVQSLVLVGLRVGIARCICHLLVVESSGSRQAVLVEPAFRQGVFDVFPGVGASGTRVFRGDDSLLAAACAQKEQAEKHGEDERGQKSFLHEFS